MGAGSVAGPAAWKMNMIVLMLIYPIVFLFSLFVQTPILMARLHFPFWFALFIGNIVSVLILDRLVPWTSRRLDWWLRPLGVDKGSTVLAGAGLIVALYALSPLLVSHL
jgi:antibiotic biosynthesis monooxygenase (ABM) superfamily enzyme